MNLWLHCDGSQCTEMSHSKVLFPRSVMPMLSCLTDPPQFKVPTDAVVQIFDPDQYGCICQSVYHTFLPIICARISSRSGAETHLAEILFFFFFLKKKKVVLESRSKFEPKKEIMKDNTAMNLWIIAICVQQVAVWTSFYFQLRTKLCNKATYIL